MHEKLFNKLQLVNTDFEPLSGILHRIDPILRLLQQRIVHVASGNLGVQSTACVFPHRDHNVPVHVCNRVAQYGSILSDQFYRNQWSCPQRPNAQDILFVGFWDSEREGSALEACQHLPGTSGVPLGDQPTGWTRWKVEPITQYRTPLHSAFGRVGHDWFDCIRNLDATATIWTDGALHNLVGAVCFDYDECYNAILPVCLPIHLKASISSGIKFFNVHNVFFFVRSRLEEYRRPSTALNINLMRNFLLQLCIVGVLMFYWLNKTYDHCWETSVGQEIYRLIVIDFVVSVIFLACLQASRYAMNRYYNRSISLSEFCITNNSLGLVYNQTLLWFGLLFSPMLCVVVAAKLFLTFYIKKLSLIYFCKPQSKLWRSSQTQTLFLVLVFVSLFGVIITHGYIITQIPVSEECGPFRGNTFMYQLFMEGILKLQEEHIFWKIFSYVTKPAIIGGLLLTMGVVTYYLRAKSKAQIAKVKLLKEMLCMEAKDKEFLLANISKITRGKEWNFDRDLLNGRKSSTADKYYSDPSATWRYADSPRKISGNSVLRDDEESPTGSGYHRELLMIFV